MDIITLQKLKNEVTIVDIAVVMNRQQNPQCTMKFKSLFYKNDITRYKSKKEI